MIIDTHAHLMFPEFKEDFEEVLKRAKDAGISKVVNVGCDLKSCQQSVEMSGKYSELFATLGMHPYEAELVNEELMNEWRKIIPNNKKIVAIGECGLDYFKSKVEKEVQKNAFRLQVKLAKEFSLPLIVHNREADDDSLAILDEAFSDGKKVPVVFHCYGSTLEFARKLWDRGILTSFTGIVTYPNAKIVHEVAKEVPMNLFMVETDCPYLAPQSYRGKRNESSYVIEVIREIAKIKGISFKEVEENSTENASKFFSKI
ncbi:MAG: TatD family hydrolase [Candidatus Gracilibacteria bacterium]